VPELSKKSLATPAHFLGFFLESLQSHGQDQLLVSFCNYLTPHASEIVETALEESLDQLARLLNVASRLGPCAGLVGAIWNALGAHPQRVANRCLQSSATSTIHFIRIAEKHRQHDFLRSFVERLSQQSDMFVETAIKRRLEGIGLLMNAIHK